MVDIAAPDNSLDNNPPTYGAAHSGISTIDTPVVADVSIVDDPMPDAPTDQATFESLTGTPPSRAKKSEVRCSELA